MSKFDEQKVILKNDKEIIFRNLDPNDAAKYIYFCEIIARESAHTSQYPGQLISIDTIKEKFKKSMESPFAMELGGFDKDLLIAHLSFYKPSPHPYLKHIGEFGIKIVKDFSGMGLGSNMMLIMENIAKKMNIKRIQAKVRVSNHLGVNFYRKHLYEIEGIKKNAAFINGLYEDEYYIAKILSD